MSKEKKTVELKDEELEKVNGGIPEDCPEDTSDPFIGLAEGDVYKAKIACECDYCKISKIHKNTGVIDYWPGVLQGDHIQRSYPVRYATLGVFRECFKTEKFTNIPWHDF